MGTHLSIGSVLDPAIVRIKFLIPPMMPRASALQVCAMRCAQLKEPLCGRPDVALVLGGVELAHEGFERGDVAPGPRAHGTREQDAEGGEAEAALALLGSRATAKDAHPAHSVLREVPDTER